MVGMFSMLSIWSNQFGFRGGLSRLLRVLVDHNEVVDVLV